MDNVRALALEHRPKIVLAGYSAYPRHLDYEAFRSIADEIDAVFMVDAAHFIGLVAGRAFPNPVEHADIVTATTHKALRGPRGGMILSTAEYAKLVDKAVFPGGQGGPIMSQIAAKAVCFHENDTEEFRAYAAQIIANASAMADRLQADGVRLVTGGTDNHLMLVDLRSVDEDLTGREAAKLLDSIGITLNFNSIPNDPRPPMHTSGLRIGTPAMTTQGMTEPQADQTAGLIAAALRSHADEGALKQIETEIRALAASFPPYPTSRDGLRACPSNTTLTVM
jgi:glycine hydroxymethyltransferase